MQNNSLSFDILSHISKQLIKGLFPYVFKDSIINSSNRLLLNHNSKKIKANVVKESSFKKKHNKPKLSNKKTNYMEDDFNDESDYNNYNTKENLKTNKQDRANACYDENNEARKVAYGLAGSNKVNNEIIGSEKNNLNSVKEKFSHTKAATNSFTSEDNPNNNELPLLNNQFRYQRRRLQNARGKQVSNFSYKEISIPINYNGEYKEERSKNLANNNNFKSNSVKKYYQAGLEEETLPNNQANLNHKTNNIKPLHSKSNIKREPLNSYVPKYNTLPNNKEQQNKQYSISRQVNAQKELLYSQHSKLNHSMNNNNYYSPKYVYNNELEQVNISMQPNNYNRTVVVNKSSNVAPLKYRNFNNKHTNY